MKDLVIDHGAGTITAQTEAGAGFIYETLMERRKAAKKFRSYIVATGRALRLERHAEHQALAVEVR